MDVRTILKSALSSPLTAVNAPLSTWLDLGPIISNALTCSLISAISTSVSSIDQLGRARTSDVAFRSSRETSSNMSGWKRSHSVLDWLWSASEEIVFCPSTAVLSSFCATLNLHRTWSPVWKFTGRHMIVADPIKPKGYALHSYIWVLKIREPVTQLRIDLW